MDLRHGARLIALQIQHDRALAAIDQMKERALALNKGADVAVFIAARRFKLDHIGTKISQQRRAIGPCQHPCQVKDADAAEGTISHCGQAPVPHRQ